MATVSCISPTSNPAAHSPPAAPHRHCRPSLLAIRLHRNPMPSLRAASKNGGRRFISHNFLFPEDDLAPEPVKDQPAQPEVASDQSAVPGLPSIPSFPTSVPGLSSVPGLLSSVPVSPKSVPGLIKSVPGLSSVPGPPTSVPDLPTSVPGLQSVPGLPKSVPGLPAATDVAAAIDDLEAAVEDLPTVAEDLALAAKDKAKDLASSAAELASDSVIGLTAAVGDLLELAELKKRLKLLVRGEGVQDSWERKPKIMELINQLEAKNPTPAPTDELALLNGKWILAYTTFPQLMPVLGFGMLPELVKVEEISETIDSDNFTLQSSVKFVGPLALASASVATNAKFKVQSTKRVQIKFEEVEFQIFGPNIIDLSPFKGVFTSIHDAASSITRNINGQTPLKIPISSDWAQSWFLTTYLDQDLRISQGDGGCVFVLIKEGSSLLSLTKML